MDPVAWANEHWIAVYFGVDALLFGASVLLWKPGSRPLAALLFVVALLLPLAFGTVLFTNWVLEQEEADERRRPSR